ncbi:MAG TPA: neutral/alkaline non-lysosomal ceramidase N-terminal domain-containing protein [Chitinophagales bacterium]|nr:neutral/alkaline non-lysosomal ceramidase N-terminal domain-containing protein [Chitinophagales bacterium]HRK26024.1 neutral/alkaline non-lysosomal ceramidase N-terminal domain-containing protein [Chitinophagales bacterium]
MYQVGVAKEDITAFVYGKGMMGYAVPTHIVTDVETPIHVRAFVIRHKNTGKTVALVNAEICFYTIAVKDAVVKKLQQEYPQMGYTDANVLLSAQHTHSAPGGYSHYVLYNVAIPGFQPKVFDAIVNGTVKAIVKATQNLQDAQLFYQTGAFDPDVPVAFNRSIKAYNNNPEVGKPLLKKDHHLAIDRNMKLLRFDAAGGAAIGAFNWFGVHTTSVGNTHHRICFDNKGYAAQFMEEKMQTNTANDHFVAAFAQDTGGDVSPNHQYEPAVPVNQEYQSAKKNGQYQFEKASQLFETAPDAQPLTGDIDYELLYINMANIAVDSEFVLGRTGLRTAPAAVGLHMLLGANDRPALDVVSNFLLGLGGPTLPKLIRAYENSVLKLFRTQKDIEDIQLKYRAHGRKQITIESSIGKILGTYYIQKLIIPGALDETINRMKQIDREGYFARTPWMPRIVPLQIIIIGELALIGIAAEITTIAGKRIADTALRILKHRGIKHVIPASFANGYHGYITTTQEYRAQLYEGAHTIFGKWTLPAYQTKIKQLATQMLKPKNERQMDTQLKPELFAPDEIWYG